MSYFRPPSTLPTTAWIGRVGAAGWALLGAMSVKWPVNGFAGLAGTTTLETLGTVATTFTPLALGGFAALSIWNCASKAAEVRHDNKAYIRATRAAQAAGKSEAHLPARMLDKDAQVSGFATAASGLISAAGILYGGVGLFRALGSLATVGMTATTGGLALVGAIALTAGIAGWIVTNVASEARDFAYSREASAERGRILQEHQKAMAPKLAPQGPPAMRHTPISDQIDAQMDAELQAAQKQARPDFLERLLHKKSAPGATLPLKQGGWSL